MGFFRFFHLPQPTVLIEADDKDDAMAKYIEEIEKQDFEESYDGDYVADDISEAMDECKKLGLDYSDIFYEKEMPHNIQEMVQALAQEPRKNQDEILELMRKHGREECPDLDHRTKFETFDWKNLGNDDEYEHFEQCLGCGGTRS